MKLSLRFGQKVTLVAAVGYSSSVHKSPEEQWSPVECSRSRDTVASRENTVVLVNQYSVVNGERDPSGYRQVRWYRYWYKRNPDTVTVR